MIRKKTRVPTFTPSLLLNTALELYPEEIGKKKNILCILHYNKNT